MVPPQFGFQAKMETSMDRKFWEFCESNPSVVYSWVVRADHLQTLKIGAPGGVYLKTPIYG